MDTPHIDIDVLVLWYCRGCKNSVQQSVKPDAEVVACPRCGTEKLRHEFEERER